MPRPSQSKDPTARRNAVSAMLTDDELAMVKRVQQRYGVSKSTAARFLITAGAAHHDPERTDRDEQP